MRLLLDMNLTPRWISFLQSGGHVAVHWSFVGPATAKDSEICAYARESEFILITNDLDFPLILAHTRRAKPSVVLLRGAALLPEVRGQSLLEALSACEEQLNAGAIVSIDWVGPPRARILPLS